MADLFYDFCMLCESLGKEPSYNNKTSIIKEFIDGKSTKGKYNGDLVLFAKLLLPGAEKRIYNLKDKQILKHMSQIFQTDHQEMIENLEEQGIVSDTVKLFFKQSATSVKPLKRSALTLQQVEGYLNDLSKETKEEGQIHVLKKIASKCSAKDLCCIVKLIKHDLRINTGPKHFFDALDVNAYALYQASSNLKGVVEKWMSTNTISAPGSMKKSLSIKASLMTPVKPMLAEACKSIEQAFKKCPNGLFSEIKYDGERVQVHKDGENFQYFSRSLKQGQPHKIAHIKEYLPKACPSGDSLILDGEVLLMDTKTNQPLPFGTLGIHKKSKFTEATVCYVIFDILQFNDENLLNKPICERREILLENVKEIENRIIHSEMIKITKKEQLQSQLKKVFAENLEGLVVKDVKSKYEPGKRHWLKIKKDYLQEGAMADSADLVVLGAYYGTGNKGGMMSVFLMGCYDEENKIWKTVAKCGNGHDDDTLKKLQTSLNMKKISKEVVNLPSWIDINRSIVPDFLTTDPKTAPVWEITGAEFSSSTTHTAAGISIRFPRVTKIRSDKDWQTATNLKQLQKLFEESKRMTDVEIPESSPVKPSKSPSKNKKSATKRKNDSDDEPSVVAKQQKFDLPQSSKKNKPVCKYGAECYRKNADHLNEYEHTSVQLNSSKHLENLFTNLVFRIANNVKEKKKLKRYIVAYDGDVTRDDEVTKATHIVSEIKLSDDNDDSVVVTPDWVWSCVKEKQLVPVEESTRDTT